MPLSTVIVINHTSPIETPVSGANKPNMRKLINFLEGLNSGSIIGSAVDVVSNNAVAGIASSATVTAATVVNGNTVTIAGTSLTATQKNSRSTATCAAVAAADTVTVNGTVFTSAKMNASSTATCATALANDTVTVNGVVFTGTAGAVTLGAGTFSIDTSDTAAATSLAAQVSAHASLSPILSATSAAGVVTIRALASGTAGNAYTLTSSNGTRLAVSGSGFLAGGIAATTATFDAAVAGFNTQVAASLVTAINANAATSLIVTATNAAGVVTIRSIVAGTAGDAYTLTSSNGTRLAVSGSGFLAGGAALSNNTFDFGGAATLNNTQTATALAAAINASTTAKILNNVRATSSAAVVTITCTQKSALGNHITLTSSGSTLTVTGSGFLINGTGGIGTAVAVSI